MFTTLFTLVALLAQDPLPPKAFAALAARSIGPAGMSGRVAAVDAVATDPNVIWVGAATGGLWLSRDGGLTFKPVFDDQPVASIGAIAIDQRAPDRVWVGTGEGNPRNSASVGDGIFRTLDGGATWRHLGLAGTERIARLALDPTDFDVAYAAALGTSWGESAERGVYRTQDGGSTWQRVLFVDERTGCADLVMDPTNPRKLFAAMWDHRRQPHTFRSGGPGSGIFVTHDGGATWERVTRGLPDGDLGRIGLAIAPSDPRVVYALVEAKDNVLLRSDDGGYSFNVVNDDREVSPRPFYYADIRVCPDDPKRLYRLATVVDVSEDGGRTFRNLIPYELIHPDHHALWISPTDGRVIVDGNDGGVALSRDRGATWRFVSNLPLAQYYHVAVDMDVPFNVYGGMQDNGSWRGPSAVWENGGIRNLHWDEVGFGDGFATWPLPDDSTRGYAMSQGGALFRWNNVTGERKGIQPDPPRSEAGGEAVELRFNWNAGIALDPHDVATVYYGSQFVHRSRDRGETWEVISPDLTTNEPEWQRQSESGGLTLDVTAAENHCSILCIAPSPLEPQTLWVSTDDGRLHVTRDGGATWTSLEERMRGVPRNTWLPHVEASKHHADTAYVVADDHRRASWAPYILVTRDGGHSWTNLATGDVRGYCLTLEEDPVDPELLYLGTEFGLYVSQDGGASWWRWTHGVPTVGVRSLVVHPREHSLVIGTHGRAAYVIDDVRPLRRMPSSEIVLYPVGHTWQHQVRQTPASRFAGSTEYRGQNRPFGALVHFSVAASLRERVRAAASAAEGEAAEPARAKVEFIAPDGQVVRAVRVTPSENLERVVWDLCEHGPRGLGATGPTLELSGGAAVLPGNYTVRVTYGDEIATTSFDVLADPRVEYDLAGWAEKNALLRETGALVEEYARLVERLEYVRADARALVALAERNLDPDAADGAPHPHKALRDAGEDLQEALETFERTLRQTSREKGIQRDRISRTVFFARGQLQSSWDAPTPAQRVRIEEARLAMSEARAGWSAIAAGELATFRAALEASGLSLLGALGDG